MVEDTTAADTLLVSFDDITIDTEIQLRIGTNRETVFRYLDIMLKAGGWGDFPPVDLFGDESGYLLLADGFHRIEAARRAKIKEIPAIVHHGSVGDAILFAASCNVRHGLALSNDDKRKAVKTLLSRDDLGDLSNRKIAELAGVSHTFVNRVAHMLIVVGSKASRSGNVSTDETTTATATTTAREEAPAATDTEADTAADGIETTAPTSTTTSAIEHEPTSSRAALHSSESNEWYTPLWVLDAARQALGGPFDLDPASCLAANERVGAKEIFTLDDDGLSREWSAARLWLNPPYGGQTGAWTDRLVAHWRRGDVTSAIVLVGAVPDRRWFQKLWSTASAVCFFRRRVQFIDEHGKPGPQPTHGHAAFYLSPSSARGFVDAFGEHGRIVVDVLQAQRMGRVDTAWRAAL